MAAATDPVTRHVLPAPLVDSVFRIASRHFKGASDRHPHETGITLAGFHIRLSSNDDELHRYAAPHFAHLADVGDFLPDLTLHAAIDPDSLASIGSSLPADAFAEPDRSTVVASGSIVTSLHYGAARNPILLNAYDGSRKVGVSVAASCGSVHHVEGIRPFLEIIRWWSADTPLVFAHAAAVATLNSGFWLTGPAMTGKSSTSLAVSGGQLKFLGDDVVCIGPGPKLRSIYAAARLRPDMVARFASGQRWFDSGWYDWNGKPSQLFAGQTLRHMLREAPLSAIVMPRKTNSGGFRRVSTAEAFRSLAPSTLATMPIGRVQTLDKLTSALAGVPAFEFGIGPDLDIMRAAFERFAAGQEFQQ
jgi:hypothetical protein